MVIPDRIMVRKIKRYDPNLFVLWNNRKNYFELWMKRPWHRGGGAVLITPVVKSIYDPEQKPVFTSLDERLLWWLMEADSHRHGGPEKFALNHDSRWQEFNQKKKIKDRQNIYDRAKDLWSDANSFYTTKSKAKNGKPKFLPNVEQKPFLRPDMPYRTSGRLMGRSKQNALKYGFKR